MGDQIVPEDVDVTLGHRDLEKSFDPFAEGVRQLSD
jgi:hypothetical protein